ncbi:hypothetical protein D3C83_18790 [compost metagenome]
MPCQEPRSSSGNPDSIIVGVSGSGGMRFFATTARTLILPLLAWGTSDAVVTIVAATSPLMVAIVEAPAPPLYGTCRSLMPALLMKNSKAMRCALA